MIHKKMNKIKIYVNGWRTMMNNLHPLLQICQFKILKMKMLGNVGKINQKM